MNTLRFPLGWEPMIPFLPFASRAKESFLAWVTTEGGLSSGGVSEISCLGHLSRWEFKKMLVILWYVAPTDLTWCPPHFARSKFPRNQWMVLPPVWQLQPWGRNVRCYIRLLSYFWEFLLTATNQKSPVHCIVFPTMVQIVKFPPILPIDKRPIPSCRPLLARLRHNAISGLNIQDFA